LYKIRIKLTIYQINTKISLIQPLKLCQLRSICFFSYSKYKLWNCTYWVSSKQVPHVNLWSQKLFKICFYGCVKMLTPFIWFCSFLVVGLKYSFCSTWTVNGICVFGYFLLFSFTFHDFSNHISWCSVIEIN